MTNAPSNTLVLAGTGKTGSRLGQGTLRFTELKRSVDGISQRMLTLTLPQLPAPGGQI